ncbi:MAG TPA: ATP-binding protein, partial [Gemmatimonadaceae bacterium]|nr:ATP-binding protein [Gemmatimonadaceae bacterium]
QQIAEIGTWEVDPVTRDVFWSEEMYRLLETTPNDFAPSFETFMDRVHEDDRSLVRSKMGKAMRGEGAFSEEIRVHRPDGSIRRLLTRGDLVTWHGVGRRKVVGTAQDITERKRAEKELHDTEARLRQAQKMEAVGQLAGGLAHDFNNLLTVILSYSAMLLAAHTESDETTGSLREIKGAAERAAALTRQLLAFTRQQLLQPRLLDLNETVTNVDRMLRRLITENIEVRTVLSTALGFVKADPGQIEQVLINLAVNARDAMRDGGTLTIETNNVELDGSYVHQGAVAKAGPYVMLAVTDTGTGIPPDIRERIFEPFFTTKAQGHGTGLGLSTVHGIVEQSGGHVWVYSEMGIGTTFKVYLPRVAHEDADAQRPAAAPATKRGTETVLLVEDDAAVRSVASRVLSRAGYTVIEAANGAEAIRLCDDPSRVLDLIVSDMVMPGISGPDLARELRARRPKAGILLMSGYTRDSVVRDGLLRNESFFIEKPFTPDALLRTVREILDHAPAPPVASA